jgi:hypothetical protein
LEREFELKIPYIWELPGQKKPGEAWNGITLRDVMEEVLKKTATIASALCKTQGDPKPEPKLVRVDEIRVTEGKDTLRYELTAVYKISGAVAAAIAMSKP